MSDGDVDVDGELPAGWRIAPALELCSAIPNGSTPKSDFMGTSGEVPFVKVYNLTFDGSLDFSKDPTFISRETHEKLLRRSRSKSGDVLMNIVGPPLGKISILPDIFPEWNFNQAIVAFQVRPERLDNRFLAYFLRKQAVAWSAKFSKATVGQHNIAVSDCRDIQVPHPPLPEQRRIVAKLESLQARSRRAREALEAVPPLLEKLRQSILAAAFRGDLTADWRAQHPDVEPASELLKRIRIERRKKWEQAELAKLKAKGKTPTDDKWKQKYVEPEPVDDSELPELPEGWVWASVEELAVLVTDGDHNPPKRISTGIPHLTAGNIKNQSISLDGCSFVSEQGFEQTRARYEPQESDIIVTCVGTLGETAIVPPGLTFSADRNLAAIRLVHNGIPSQYLQFWLNTYGVQQHIAGASGSTAQPHLYLSDIRRLSVPIAPAAEQHAIIGGLSETLARLANRRNLNRQLSEQLRSIDMGVLSKAFRGELVPQDPNDAIESALAAPTTKTVPAPTQTQKSKTGNSRAKD